MKTLVRERLVTFDDATKTYTISPVGFSAQFNKTAIKALGEDLRDRATEISRAMSGQKV